jgi:uncharacterized protein HemX
LEAQRKEETMKITNLVLALVIAGALAAFGQEGTAQDIKQGAKEAGEKIKEGAETVGEKTKEAAKAVGEKTKETAETVDKKTKETVEGTGDKMKESTSTHRKSRKTWKRATAHTTEEQSTNQESNSPSPSER